MERSWDSRLSVQIRTSCAKPEFGKWKDPGSVHGYLDDSNQWLALVEKSPEDLPDNLFCSVTRTKQLIRPPWPEVPAPWCLVRC